MVGQPGRAGVAARRGGVDQRGGAAVVGGPGRAGSPGRPVYEIVNAARQRLHRLNPLAAHDAMRRGATLVEHPPPRAATG